MKKIFSNLFLIVYAEFAILLIFIIPSDVLSIICITIGGLLLGVYFALLGIYLQEKIIETDLFKVPINPKYSELL